MKRGRESASPRSAARLTVFVLVFALGAASSHAATGMLRIHAVEPSTGGPAPFVPVRVGSVRRLALAPSGRLRLALRPAQVAAGGRLFTFAELAPGPGGEAFDVEVLLWIEGHWQRERVIRRPAATVGYIGATLVLPDLEAGPVVTALFRRSAAAGAVHTIDTVAFEVPVGAKLALAYSLDESVWQGLAPVTVSLGVTVVQEGQPEAEETELLRRRLRPGQQPAAWYEERIDLGAFSGQVVKLHLHDLSEADPRLLPPHVVWSAPELIAPDDKEIGRPAVVLVSLDSVRARSLGCCGAKRRVSPFLDVLFGDQGVIFDHAVSPAARSVPAHMSLLTSLYPSVHGVFSWDRALGPEVRTLPQVMAQHGYATAAFSDGAALAAEIGFGRGFDSFVLSGDLDAQDLDSRAAATFDAALRWIEQHRSGPFFVLIHTIQARAPYVPPRSTLDLFHDERLNRPSPVDEAALVRYEREIRSLDEVLRDFVERLDLLADPGHTLLVVTSPHGEEFLEHGAREHGTQLYEETIHVPLMMRGAGIRPSRRYTETVGLIDVAPTIIELAGIVPPEGMQGRAIGKSLRSGLPYTLPPRFSEAHASTRKGPDGKEEPWAGLAYAISDVDRKVIVEQRGKKQQLRAYDLMADPEETNDLLAAQGEAPQWVADLRQVLESYPVACQQVARSVTARPFLSWQTRQRLEALGYIR